MTTVLALQIGAFLLLLATGGGFLLRGHNARADRLGLRCRAVAERRTRTAKVRQVRERPHFGSLIGAFGTKFIRSGLLSQKTLKTLRATLVSAGLRPETALGIFVGSKVVLFGALPVLAWFLAQRFGLSLMTRNLVVAASAAIGMLLPDFVIKQMRARHIAKVERGLPDALDMMIICTEAGMAIEPAIQRVAQELRFAHPATADELSWTSTELQVTGNPETAFANMGSRTALESLRRLGVTVLQTIEYGTPLSQALRLLSGELRAEMITRFEEKAARLPVMLTVPMIVFILPALFLIIGGPAAIRVFAFRGH